MSPHKHTFSVDAACGGCGVMLSELVTTQQQEIRELTKALAASAAKVKQYERESAEENVCLRHPKTMLVYQCAACVDASLAKLQASERDRDSDRQSLMEVLKRLQESEEARGASERALERVRDRKALLQAICVALGDEELKADHLETIHGAQADRVLALLASPEARATGEDSA